MVDLSNIEDDSPQFEQTYEDAKFEAFGEFWSDSPDQTERIENHGFEGTPFNSRITGKVKADGYSSQADRDQGDTLEMLPNSFMSDADGRFANTVEALGKGELPEDVASEDEQSNMEYVDTAAENYLRTNPDEAFSPIQIAEDITPRDSVVTKEAAREVLWDNYVSNGGDFQLGEVTDAADNNDVLFYQEDELPPQQRGIGVDEAVEYLAEEQPEALNELAIQYVAGQVENELERKVEHAERESTSGGWVESYDRDTLESAGAIGDESYEVRGDTFYSMADDKMGELLAAEAGHKGNVAD